MPCDLQGTEVNQLCLTSLSEEVKGDGTLAKGEETLGKGEGPL